MPPRRHSSSLSDLPWWVQAIAYVGAPTAAAGFMIFWLTNTIASRLDAIESNAKTHIASEAIAVEQQWQVVGTLIRVCLNTSKTDADRLSCVTVPRSQDAR